MSNRTKSFFDENHSNKRNGPWQNRYPRQPLAQTGSNAVVQPRPPIPTSAETKDKLKEFQFTGAPPERASMISAGNAMSKKDTAMESKPRSTIANSGSDKSAKASTNGGKENYPDRKISLPHANTFPSTPSDKLTLDELIGNVDESRFAKPAEDSPDEVLGWNPNSSNAATTPGRKRKRARSSSPGWPSAASQKGDTGLGIKITHKTPIVDPAAELWQRYSAGNLAGDALKLPDISAALQATPRALETPIKAAGLRRWASAGNEWPSHRSKRQRTTRVWQDGQRTTTGQSKVAAMVEKIQESLASQQLDQKRASKDDPSSSSPLPGALAAFAPARSPHKSRSAETSQALRNNTTQRSLVPALTTATKGAEATKSNTPRKVQPAELPKPNRPVAKQSQDKPRLSNAPSKPIVAPQVAVIAAEDLNVLAEDIALDEFDDDDDAMFDFDIATKTTNNQPASIPGATRKPSQSAQPARPIEAHNAAPPPKEPLQLDAADLDAFDDDDFNDDGDDEFGLADMDEQELFQAEVSATQAYSKMPRHKNTSSRYRSPALKVKSTLTDVFPTSSLHQTQHKYQRFLIKKVLDCSSTTKTTTSPEKVLLVEDEVIHTTTTITLRESWISTTVSPGQIVHVAHAPMTVHDQVVPPPGQIFIEDSESSPLLVIQPDYMLSATAVADSFDCVRKAVLFDRIKATSEASKWTVYGKILHEIFQQALVANIWDEKSLKVLVVSTVTAHLEGLWQIGMRDDVMAIEEIQAKMTEMSAWASVFVRSTPSLDAKLSGSRDESLRVAVTGLVAIEEHVWSPMFGLKGNVDATVQLSEHGKTSQSVIAPFEVKTGRTTHAPSHHAQTALYTLLMSDRYDVAVKAGILYYLESSNISSISPSMHEIRQMMQQRNRLATAINYARFPDKAADFAAENSQPMPQSRLPSMAKNPEKCTRCYAQQSCFVFHAMCEDGTAESAGMIDTTKKNHSLVWEEALGHLGVTAKKTTSIAMARESPLKQWFSKWDRLLTYEEGETSRPRKELWTMSSREREEAGRCFGELKIRVDHLASSSSSGTIDGIESSGGKINRFLYTLERGTGSGRPFNDGSQLTPGEAVVVSSEEGQWALANGYVISVTHDSITVGVDRKLGDARQRLPGFDSVNNQAFKGIMTVAKSKHDEQREYSTLYRLDKDEFANGLALIRNNLVMMMSSHPNHTKLRDLIIFDQAPAFSKAIGTPRMQPSQLGDMNEDQQNAVSKVISAEDYALVLGMPGTGKTTTIAHLIRALLAQGKSILLTSYTHTAVDNILLKIRDIAPRGSILRLGVQSKINPQVQEFCHLATSPRTSFEDIDKIYLQTQIVATTCLGINNALFTHRFFDVCIVDEASQITLPVSLGPLLNARKFVLVGDHYQLSPLVQSRAALEGGLDISLFRLLSEKHPKSIAMLGKQYRMCEDIMSISNALIYDGRLRCGNDAVATRTLQLGKPGLDHCHGPTTACKAEQCWLKQLTDPKRKVFFANTDKVGPEARECLINSGKKITNRLEAVITAQTVLSLQAQGVPSSDIGVIALYRTQISLIRQLFGAASISSEVEFDSADRFQGRDKECIIISMVRSNETGTVGDLIKDWRRLNVAFTRARSKLIVIGSRSTLQNNDLLAKFLQLVDGRDQSINLPADAENNHGSSFDFVSEATVSIAPALLPHHASPVTAKHLTSPARLSQGRKHNPSPMRSMAGSQRGVLQESRSSANKGAISSGGSASGIKKPDKVIDGRGNRPSEMVRKMKEQIAFEIFEELNAEDWS